MKRCFVFSLVLLLVFAVCSLTTVGEDLQVYYPGGYKSWSHVKSMIIEPGHPLENPFQGIHHIYGNEKAIAGYKDGKFEDGAVIVFDLLNYDQAGNTIQESGRSL